MGKQIETELKVALNTGFRGGRRVKRGETFTAPVEETANWFAAADEKSRKVKQALDGEPDLLDKSIPEIINELPQLTTPELHALKGTEMNGKTRKGLIAKIDDEIANRLANGDDGKGGKQTDDLMS